VRDDLTDVLGFTVGSAEDAAARTGCTVVLCPPDGAVAGVDQRGGAPGTRETDPLAVGHLVSRCHGVLLTGGSAFGLDAAGGVVRFLEAAGVGLQTPHARVPIVPAAVIYDLGAGRADVRPDAAMAEAACREAAAGGPLALVRNGDRIRLSVKARRIELAVPEAELARRRAAWKPPVAMPARGYARLYMDHVLQAEHGCDFDFLRKA